MKRHERRNRRERRERGEEAEKEEVAADTRRKAQIGKEELTATGVKNAKKIEGRTAECAESAEKQEIRITGYRHREYETVKCETLPRINADERGWVRVRPKGRA